RCCAARTGRLAGRSPRRTPSFSSPRRSWGWSMGGARRVPSCWPAVACRGRAGRASGCCPGLGGSRAGGRGVSGRPAPRRPGGGDLERLGRSWEARGAELITLGPLDEPSVASLAGQAAGAEPAAQLVEMVAAAAGNPLYVIELARALAAEGRTPAGAVPESLI